MERIKDVIVTGGGAAGIVAAVRAAERGKSVLLLEKSDRFGRKILASGNGRCNLMNRGAPRYYGDPEFAARVLAQCTQEELTGFFRRYGLFLTEEEDGRVYPVTERSDTVLNVLKTAMEAAGVSTETNACVTGAAKENESFILSDADGKKYECRKLVIACGGTAQPKLGGSADGYRLLESFGHTLIRTFPSLVPLETDKRSVSGLSGIRVRCRVTLYEDDKALHSETGELLFTDYGISGICVMQCARFAEGRGTRMEADLLYGVFEGERQLTEELARKRKLFPDKSPVTLLEGLLASRVAYAVLKQAGIPMRGETAGELTDEDLERVARTARGYRIGITGSRGMDYAQVTAGGMDCREFDPLTMESRIVPGLYAAGEVLNVDGDCGGFNLMFAFSSGLNAGNAV